jgi:flagellum-specific peptidoglycan hydrolase FlgJ
MTEPIAAAASAAKLCQQKTGVPALLTMAQWALESGWGQHSPGNNCFGLKCYSGSRRQLLTTSEWFTEEEAARFVAELEGRTAVRQNQVAQRFDGRYLYTCRDWFAEFASLADCFIRHAALLAEGERYRKAFERYTTNKDADYLALAIAPTYATDPNYGGKLIDLMRNPRLIAAVAPGKAA